MTRDPDPTADPAWTPSGVVTWTTDFGLADPYVGILHGVVLGVSRDLRPVDLTHGIAAQDVRAAAFHLRHGWPWFPAGTVHVAVVDPGVGSARRILVARDRGHAFLAPDNGLLGPVLSPEADVRELDVEAFALPGRSRTFHGRDVFAPAAGRIAAGLAPEDAGRPAAAWERLEFPEPCAGPDGTVAGEVLVVDRFGNLITNVRSEALPGGGGLDAWVVEVAGREVPLRATYAEGAPGSLLALVDSFDAWEVAERDGSAAERLAVGVGAEVRFRRRRQ